MTRCPTPMKRAFRTKQLALQAAGRLYHKGFPVRLKAYKCRCRWWHLTKRGAVEAEIAKLMREAEHDPTDSKLDSEAAREGSAAA